jgi:flagellar biosynthesis chaperone FliJ
MEPFDRTALLKTGNSGDIAMKTPKLLGELEHKAGRQLTLILRAARKQYGRFMHSAEKVSDKAAQRRYIRAAEQTIDSAEKIIAQLRKRVASARKSLTGGPARNKTRMVKQKANRTVKKTARKAAGRKKGR